MNMKNIYGLYAMAFCGMMNDIYTSPPKLNINKPKQPNTDLILKSKGLKKFCYPKGEVWAINKKNADRKARKINLI